MKREQLGEQAHKAGVRWNLKYPRAWRPCCIYANGYIAGYRAALRRRRKG